MSIRRKHIPLQRTSINHTHAIPHDRLYAQAYKLYREGFHYWFDPTEVAQLEEHNRNFEEVSHEEELLTYLRRPYEGDTCEFVSSTRIIELVGQYVRTKLSPRKVSRIMERLGFEHRKTNGLRGWNVVILTGDDIKRNQRLNALGSTPDTDET